MRVLITLSVLFLGLALALPAYADCICRSEIQEGGISEDLSSFPTSLPPGVGGRALLVDFQLGPPSATTFVDPMPGPAIDDTDVSTGVLTLSFSATGVPGISLGQVVSLDAVVNPSTMPMCSIEETTWVDSLGGGGEVIFDFNTNTISGMMFMLVSGGIEQKHVSVDLTGTFDPTAVGTEIAVDVTGTHTGILFMPTACSVPTTNLIGGGAFAATLVVLAVMWLRRRSAVM